MKWLGIVLVCLTGVGWGTMGWFRLKRRAQTLSRFSLSIDRLSDRIRYSAQPLDGLLEEWLPKNNDPLVDPRMRLQTMIDERRGEWGLIEDDCTLLKGFANGIGRSDVDGEIRLCGEYRREVDERLWQAR